ncbi:CAP domain-containing protein [Aureimonas sp. AU4]|uniref:CAP domain-containing protein n=1 Tax=Aureimonas sp. AU4 TaxID=1638163 RepID=UPI000782259A|nr:CAP domain-containing protein [Aureimonas sp. AU4]
MPRLIPLLSLLPALALASCLSAGPKTPASLVRPITMDRDAGLRAVNAFRAENGLKPLSVNAQLDLAASRQSEAMARADRMDHQVAGALPGRAERAGYHWGTVAENIGRGYADYGAAMKGWIGSPGHRRNLLNPNVTEIGFAGARIGEDGTRYWTQILATPSKRTVASASEKPLRWGPELRFP